MKLQIEFDNLAELEEFIGSVTVGDQGKNKAVPSDGLSLGAAPAPSVPNTPMPTAPVAPKAPAAPAAPTTPPVPTAPVSPGTQAVPAALAAQGTSAVPTVQPAYALDDLARAGMTLVDSGRQADLQQLLAQFRVASLPELPPAQYGAFATALRGLGAQI